MPGAATSRGDDAPVALGYDRGREIRDAEDDAWLDEPEAEELEPDLGPDERDMDLIDGSWEERYYSGRERPRDWTNIFLGIGLLVVLSMVLPAILVLTR